MYRNDINGSSKKCPHYQGAPFTEVPQRRGSSVLSFVIALFLLFYYVMYVLLIYYYMGLIILFRV